MTVLYTCEGCGTVDAPVEVDERQPNDDVTVWFKNHVIGGIARHHERHNPACTSGMIKHIKIPLTGRTYVGGPAVH